MKRICTVLVLSMVFMLLFCFPISADDNRSISVPEDVQKYAETVAYPFLVGTLPAGEYTLGSVIDYGNVPAVNAADIPEYEGTDPMLAEANKRLKENVGKEQSSWEFFINNSSGVPVAVFEVSRTSSQTGFGFHGTWSAKGLTDALMLMKKLQKEESYPEDIWISSSGSFGYYVYGTFGETVRVITVDNEQLDESYYAVQSSRELPTNDELKTAVQEKQALLASAREEQGGAWVYGDGLVRIPAHPDSTLHVAQSSLEASEMSSGTAVLISVLIFGGFAVISGILAWAVHRKQRSEKAI